MALVVKDRVKQTTTTTGTGSIVLNGNVDGFQTFAAALANGDTTYYGIFVPSTNAYEVGLGTWTESTATLARTTILESSNSGSAVNLTAQAEVFITQPAEKAVFQDSNGDVDLGGNKILFGNLYSSTSDLPSASTYHGMFAHVHGTGKAYYAHGGNWIELVNEDTSGNVSMGGNLTVTGDLTVNGTTTTVNTTNTVVTDSLIELANGTSGSPSNDAGIVIERGSSDNAFIGYDESADKFTVGTGSFTGASTGNLTITTGTLVANVEGNVTGNVTGNADTATTAGTVTTAAQPNITSLGTLTTLTVDDITINGSTISDAGDFTIDAEGSISLDANNNGYVLVKDGGTHFGTLYKSGNNFGVYSAIQDADLLLAGNDGGSVINALTLDMSAAGAATFNAGATFGGNIVVSGTVDGRDVATDGTKLDGIESGATADQTKSDIDALNINADTVDSLHASSFLRSDAADSASGTITISTGTNPALVASSNDFAEHLEVNRSGGDYYSVIKYTNSSRECGKLGFTQNGVLIARPLSASTDSTVWHSTNDGSGSGLDADTVDGIEAASFLRSNANDTATGELTFNAKLDIANGVYLGWGGGSSRPSITGNKSSNLMQFYIGGSERLHVDTSGIGVSGIVNAESLQDDYDALSGTSPAPDADNAGAFSLTMTGNTTFTFGSVTSGRSVGFILQLTGNGSTVTWPGSVKWAGGTAPDAPASGETDILVFHTRDGGTNWYGVLASDAAA